MSRHEPIGGDSYDAGQAQEGNRPAQNARLTTPGSLSTQGYQGGAGAGDFLGLDAEVGANANAFGLMAQADTTAARQPVPEPASSAWVETRSVRESAEQADEGGFEEDVEGDEREAARDEDLHGSWSESAPKRGGVGKLVGVAAGVLVLGMLGVAGMKFMGAASDDTTSSAPVSSNATPRPARTAGLAAPVAVEEPGEPERTPVDATGEPLEAEPEPALAGASEAQVDPEAAREAFEATRGDEPPAWFDPTLDSQGEPARTGWSEEAEAVTRASTFVGDPTALLVAEAYGDAPGGDDAAATAAPAVGRAPITIVAAATEVTSTETGAEPATGAAAEPAAAAVTPEANALASAPVVVASAPSLSAPASGASGDATVGPTAPAVADTLLPSDGAVAAFNDSRQSRTSTLKVEDVLLAPTLDSSNLRQADAKDLSGVWSETSVPMQAMSSKTKVLTPNVGRVRVVLTSKDIFEGRLYAVGMGSVWLESEYGRISVDGKRIASVANIDTKEGTPALGSSGSQNLNGLEKVRVKTPGGTFYGKVIARDDKETTLITEDGSRLTLANGDVEFLTDVPKVTIGGRVDATPKKP